MQQAEQNSRRAKAEMQQRTAAEEEAREQRRAEQLAQVQAEQARVAQEKRFKSSQCQFWWQQHNQNPTPKSAQRKTESCGELLDHKYIWPSIKSTSLIRVKINTTATSSLYLN
ncbi:hypothetical protein P4054_22580 [Pseudomonas aeruginosa]|nr:hypothetical protein [Pseudomonas aeruginosa]